MNKSRIPPEKRRILLVDDDVDLLSATANLLRLMGAWDVWEAESASQARAMWNENREHIDVLVTDIVMPECFGPDLALRFKSEKATLKVIFISGRLCERDSEEFAFLSKPITCAQLEETFRRV